MYLEQSKEYSLLRTRQMLHRWNHGPCILPEFFIKKLNLSKFNVHHCYLSLLTHIGIFMKTNIRITNIGTTMVTHVLGRIFSLDNHTT